MKAEPLQSVSVPISQQPKDRFRSDASEQAIQACYDLLSSGHSLSEILVALKQVGPLNKAQSELVDAPGDPQIPHLAGEVAAPPQWEILQVAEPVEVNRSLVPLNVESSQQRARDEGKWSRPIGVVLFWLIPAMSLMLVAIAVLIDAGLLRNNGSATASAETVAPMPAITEVDRTTPERLEAVRRGAPAVTASPTEPATQAVGTAPANNQDRGPLIDKGMQERRAASSLPRPASRPSSAQRLQSQIYRSSPKEWELPRRLTDGF